MDRRKTRLSEVLAHAIGQRYGLFAAIWTQESFVFETGVECAFVVRSHVVKIISGLFEVLMLVGSGIINRSLVDAIFLEPCYFTLLFIYTNTIIFHRSNYL